MGRCPQDSDNIAAMINRIIMPGALLLAFALSVNWLLDGSEQPEEREPDNEPDLYMLNASVEQFDDDGSLQHQINAQRLTHFPLTDLTIMKSPTMALGHTQGREPWGITAQEGRIIPRSEYREEIVEFWNNVHAKRTAAQGRFISIQTESLTIYPERDYLETDARVSITNETGRTTAPGMKAFLDVERFMFLSTRRERVITTFLPNQPPHLR